MNRLARSILVVVGWSLVISTIALQTVYERVLLLLVQGIVPESSAWLKPLDLVLIFAISVLAGAVLTDPKWIIFGYVSSLLLSATIMYFCLTLPLYLGLLPNGALQVSFEAGAIVYTFRSLFLGPFIIILTGGLLGGIFGERWL